MITGAAKVAGVVGWPVAHSLSPLIHNAWIEVLGLDAAYVPLAVRDLVGFVEACRRERLFVGVNVTLPHKEAAYQSADSATTGAERAGTANVLLFLSKGELFAENTDGVGLMSALAEQAPDWDCRRGPVLVLGAGGAARGAVAALLAFGAPTVRIAARRGSAARDLAEHFGAAPVIGFSFEKLPAALQEVTAVINATSAGLKGEGDLPSMNGVPTEAVFMDMVYTPLRTPFLETAAIRGHRTVDGLAMLIGQARPSFEMFFGVAPPPPEVVDVRALCLKALGEA